MNHRLAYALTTSVAVLSLSGYIQTVPFRDAQGQIVPGSIALMKALLVLANFGFSELGLNEIYGGTISGNDRIAHLARMLGAIAITRPSPPWMIARGWNRIEW